MQGIIIENISNMYKIKVDKNVYNAIARGKIKSKDFSLAVGDFVQINVLDNSSNTAIIEKVLPRKTYIKRPKIANISQIVFVISAKNPKPDLLMLDKQLAYAEFLKIKPLIVINKIDLCSDYKQIEKDYKSIGYKVISICAKEGKQIDKLKKELKGNINAFAGNSGVGKSTIVNSIFQREITQEGDISLKNKKGKNTTTNINLYEIDKNTFIADTPGFSTFDIFEIESTDLDKYFVDIKKFINSCEFVGCSHIKEQNCGVKKAVEEGKILQGRYNNFCKIYENIKEKEAKRW